MSILYLVPNLFGPPGGIAGYCRLVCRALSGGGLSFQALALLDRGDGATPDFSYFAAKGSRMSFIWQAIKICLQKSPQIVLVGHPNFAGLGWLLSRLCRAKLVTTIYGVDVWSRLSAFRRKGLNGSDLILSISQFTAEKGERMNGFPAGNIRILHNCLAPDFICPKPNRKPQLSMLTVARLSQAEQYKGHDYVIRAMPTLLNQFPQLTYHIVGDGDWRPELEKLVAEHQLQTAVLFHGLVSEAELSKQYAQATLFIMPSRLEGFGFVFLEAMIAGLPIIGGNLDATPEVVMNGVTGFTVDPLSVTEIAQAAAKLLADPHLCYQMGLAGLATVQQKFSFPDFQQKLLTYLAELS